MESAATSCNMDPSHPAYNIDWVFSGVVRDHAAQDREWFTTYTPITSKVTTLFGKKLSVVGIGTVHLPLQTHRETSNGKTTKNKKKSGGASSSASQVASNTPSSSTAQTTAPNSSILVLNNVLHVPEMYYNTVSAHEIDKAYKIEGMTDRATIKDKTTGAALGFTELTPFLPKFRLAGQKAGASSGDASTRPQTYKWSPQERQRWTLGGRATSNSKAGSQTVPSDSKAGSRTFYSGPTAQQMAEIQARQWEAENRHRESVERLHARVKAKAEQEEEEERRCRELPSDDGADEWSTDDE